MKPPLRQKQAGCGECRRCDSDGPPAGPERPGEVFTGRRFAGMAAMVFLLPLGLAVAAAAATPKNCTSLAAAGGLLAGVLIARAAAKAIGAREKRNE